MKPTLLSVYFELRKFVGIQNLVDIMLFTWIEEVFGYVLCLWNRLVKLTTGE